MRFWAILAPTLLVKLYQVTLSPLLGRQCRYWPTCSWYAMDALRAHGLFRGLALTSRRIARCHPLAKGGFDPVPGVHGPHGTPACDNHGDAVSRDRSGRQADGPGAGR
ncbi:MAG: membrane protein insertion efficiency factor YidD [Planctomycetota bacterium]|nr:membrane protein insertion efficiency factor YidD [Planctomycetota bacterium]